MIIIKKYISKKITKTFFSVLFLFTVISFFMQIISQIKLLGKGDYDLLQLIMYVTFLTPRNLYRLFPMISLISIVIAMARLVMKNELVAIAASGVGILAITRIVFISRIKIVFLAVLIGEGFSVELENIAKYRQITAFYGGNALVTRGGLWLHEGDWFTNIGSINIDNSLNNITRYQLEANSNNLLRTEHAENAIFNNGVWQLNKVLWSNFSDENINSGSNDTLEWQTSLDSTLISSAKINPSRQPLWVLIHTVFIGSHLALAQSSADYIFWQRILQPFICIIMLVLAVILFFNFAREKSISNKVMSSLSLGIGFYLLREYLAALCLYYSVPALFSAFIPLILGIILWLLLLRKYFGRSVVLKFLRG